MDASDKQGLPGNDEIETELRAYLDLYQTQEHPDRIRQLRIIALSLMQELEAFTPYLTGPVLKGIAGPYAEIELQLFPDSDKDVEMFLLNRNIAFSSTEIRRYSGDRARSVALLELEWESAPVKLSLFDSRDERIALKCTQAGRVIGRAGINEVGALVRAAGG